MMFVVFAISAIAMACAGYQQNVASDPARPYSVPAAQDPTNNQNYGQYYQQYGYSGEYHDDDDGTCRRLKHFRVSEVGVQTVEPRIRYYDRNGETHAAVECPNDGNTWQIIAERRGETGPLGVPNSVNLAYGSNPAVIIRCSGRKRRFSAHPLQSSKSHTIKRVTCVRD